MACRTVLLCALAAGLASGAAAASDPQPVPPTATPIKHLVILFSENVSFDHYFATYPNAANPPGEPAFTAAPGTPVVDNLLTADLLTNNPNHQPRERRRRRRAVPAGPHQANTADQNHAYTAEQQAYNGGRADLFPKYTGNGTPGGAGAFGTTGQVMGYFDGNTVTALWNYAQHFAMSDNAFTDTYGPSTPGMLEVVAGQTNGMTHRRHQQEALHPRRRVVLHRRTVRAAITMINDVDPGLRCLLVPQRPGDDDRQEHRRPAERRRHHLGRLHGRLQPGGEQRQRHHRLQRAARARRWSARTSPDYIPHHAWFQYFATTANPAHAAPGRGRRHRPQLRSRRADARSGQPPVRPGGFLRPP